MEGIGMTFDEFKQIVRDGLKSGEIKCTKELNDLDLAVQFAIGRIGDRRGYPLDTTTDEIVSEIKAFAPEVLEE